MNQNVANLVARLADRLSRSSNGELVTYDELSQAIGQDIKPVRYLIYKALKRLETDMGAKFKSVSRQGYQRLHSHELHLIGKTARRQVRRTARRANTGMSAAMRVANDLSPDEMNVLLREQSALGLLEHIAKDRSLPQVPMTETKPLTPGQAAQSFLDAIGSKKMT